MSGSLLYSLCTAMMTPSPPDGTLFSLYTFYSLKIISESLVLGSNQDFVPSKMSDKHFLAHWKFYTVSS